MVFGDVLLQKNLFWLNYTSSVSQNDVFGDVLFQMFDDIVLYQHKVTK